MTTYSRIVDYAAKDALLTGNPSKLIKGTEIGAEFDAVATADATSLKTGGALGTPSSGTLTNCTGLPVSTGISGLGTGVATALAVNVGSAGAPVVNGGALGTPSSGTLTSCTGLPVSTGISGLGTGVATALAVNVGSAGAPVVNGGALGSPSSAGTLPAFTLGGTVTSNGQSFSGTIADLGTVTTADINGGTVDGAVIGGSSAAAGSFTTLAASGAISANGGQIVFPATQNASANANTLDDYEEGTWTPTVTGATVVGTPTYDGHYTKIGRLVRFVLYVTSTTSFESTNRTGVYFTLPFAPVASNTGTGTLSAVNAGSNAEYGQNLIATNNRAYFPVIAAGSDIVVAGEYHTAT